jgi:lysophospholipase L1-like esterase
VTLLVRKHDRIVFLGDSITEQQLYSNYVETYLATRFPEFALTFFNAGWGGDTAPGGLARLDRDVLRLKPDVVTVCYGMNDGRYQPSTPEIVETFSNGLSGLVKRLKKAGVRVVLLTPGIVDEAKGAHLAACHYNRCLRPIADAVVRLAKKERLPVADLHRLMSEVDARAKSADAAFCMIPDGVHPDPAGHLVMAHGLLTALGVPPRREIIRIPAGKPSVEGDRSITVPLLSADLQRHHPDGARYHCRHGNCRRCGPPQPAHPCRRFRHRHRPGQPVLLRADTARCGRFALHGR